MSLVVQTQYKTNSGFTLIELIAVIVILGVLAATAIPRFVNLSSAAKNCGLRGYSRRNEFDHNDGENGGNYSGVKGSGY